MANSNGKIIAPVRMPTDIASVLGITATDLATVCKSSAINMWAKYKPVALNVIDTVTGQWDSTNNKWLASATWWHGNPNYGFGGLMPKEVPSLALLVAAYDGAMNGWVYTKPSGNATSPYRLQDFAGYNHNAPPAVANFYIQPEIEQNGRFHADALMSMPDANADYISIADFQSMAYGQLYFGIAFVNSSGTVLARLTATEVGTTGVDGTFQGSGHIISIGTNVKVYPFFCNKILYITDTGETSGTKWFTCPNVQYADTTIVSDASSTDAICSASYNIGSTTLINVHVTGDSSIAFTNCHWYIIPVQYWSAPDTTKAVKTSGAFNIGIGETKNWKKQSVTEGIYFLYVTLNTAQYTLKANIIQPPSPQ